MGQLEMEMENVAYLKSVRAGALYQKKQLQIFKVSSILLHGFRFLLFPFQIFVILSTVV